MLKREHLIRWLPSLGWGPRTASRSRLLSAAPAPNQATIPQDEHTGYLSPRELWDTCNSRTNSGVTGGCSEQLRSGGSDLSARRYGPSWHKLHPPALPLLLPVPPLPDRSRGTSSTPALSGPAPRAKSCSLVPRGQPQESQHCHHRSGFPISWGLRPAGPAVGAECE